MFIKTKILKHLFVPYELALLAKEKEFDEEDMEESINEEN